MLAWPRAPDTARIEFLATISRPQDVGIRGSVSQRVLAVLGGRPLPALRQPTAVAADPAGILYVADVGLHGIHVLDHRHGRYRFISHIGSWALRAPVGLALDAAGALHVADSEGRAVLITDSEGRDRGRLPLDAVRPTSVVADSVAARVLVTDTHGHRVVECRAGRPCATVTGGRGVAAGEFNFPLGVAVASDGAFLVTDGLNFRVQEFSSEGRFVRTFGELGSGVGQLARPKGIAVNSDGHVFVVEGLYDAVNIYDRAGRLLLSFGESGHAPGQFWLPTSITIDAADRIYVADSYNGRVQVFQYRRPAP